MSSSVVWDKDIPWASVDWRKQGYPRHTVGLQTCWGAMVSPSWLAGKDLPASPGMGSHKDDESHPKGDHGALCHQAAGGRGCCEWVPHRLWGQCSEQVPGMGVTSMLRPPRAPGARTGAHVPMRAWAGRRWGIQEPRQQTAQALWMIYIKAPSSQFNMGLLKL